MTARPVDDPDVWWHLRTGQYIVQTHSVPHHDIYSFTNPGKPWIAHEWLSEVILYGVYRGLGWAGLIVIFGFVVGGAFALTYFRSAGRPYIAGLSVLLAAVAAYPTWGVRPQMFSLLLTSVFLSVLLGNEDTGQWTRLLWWLPLLMLLWANLHAGYAVGLVLIGVVLAGTLLDAAFGFESRENGSRKARALAIILVVCTAVVLVNPNGIRLLSYPVETLRSQAQQSYIAEWVSPNFHEGRFQGFLALLFLTFLALVVSPKRARPRDLLLLVGTAYGGMRSIRHIPIFALVAAPILAEHLYAAAREKTWAGWLDGRDRVPNARKAALNALLVLAVLAFAAVRIGLLIHRQGATEAEKYPAAAVRFLSSDRPAGPIFNYYDWGGYFIWKLYPTYRVYIDGRADVYGDEFLDSFAQTYRAQGDWRAPLEQYGIRTVVLPPKTAMAVALRREPGWSEIFEDKQAVIFTRTSGAKAGSVPEGSQHVSVSPTGQSQRPSVSEIGH
jgi:hypothetical protein